MVWDVGDDRTYVRPTEPQGRTFSPAPSRRGDEPVNPSGVKLKIVDPFFGRTYLYGAERTERGDKKYKGDKKDKPVYQGEMRVGVYDPDSSQMAFPPFVPYMVTAEQVRRDKNIEARVEEVYGMEAFEKRVLAHSPGIPFSLTGEPHSTLSPATVRRWQEEIYARRAAEGAARTAQLELQFDLYH